MAVVAHADCARMLDSIYHANFGGATGVAYRIDRAQMIGITRRPVFHKTSVDDVADLLVPYGLLLLDRDKFYVVAHRLSFQAVPFTHVGHSIDAGASGAPVVDTDEGKFSMQTPSACAQLLAQLFVEQAKLSATGNFRISRHDLIRLTGRPVIHQTIIEDIGDWLVGHGLILVDRDSYFVVLHHDYFSDIRQVDDATLAAFSREPVFGEPLAPSV